MDKKMIGKVIIPGTAEGETIVSGERLSFWGGVEPETGEVIDRRHDCSGKILKDKIFVFPYSKGSSTGSAVLMECMKNGTAPAAIINLKLDPILALGTIIIEVLYKKTIPMIVVGEKDFQKIKNNMKVSIQTDGTILIDS